MTTQRQVHYRSCNLCEAICGLEIETEGGRVVSIRGDEHDPLSKGHICPKAVALQDVYADPDRLRTPLKRVGTQWHPVSWEQAFDEVTQQLKAVRAAHGPDAVAVYQGNPSVHNSGTLLTGPGFFKSLGSKNRYSATSVDQLPHHLAAAEMLGHPLLLPIPDLDRTDFMLIVGANPLASNGSIMTAPGVKSRLRAIQKRGGKVVVIDPRRTETAQMADEHHFVRPGSDALLLLAVLQALFDEGKVDLGRLADFTDGLDDLRQACRDFTPETVAERTGISAETIRRLALEFAAAPRAVAYGRVGLSMQPFGGLCQWLLNALNAVTGNFDREGGAMFPTPAIDLLARAKPGAAYFGRFTSRVRGLPEFDGELPVAALAEEILTPGPGQVRALVTSAGNPVLSTPNGGQLDRALENLEFMVSVDIYLNETTRHAHYILPPATGLETDHYDLIFHTFAVRNTAKYSPATLPKAAEARYDWEIFEELRNRMNSGDGPLPAPRNPEEKLDFSLRHGPHALGLDQLKANPHGLDLGPLVPRLPERLLTADGRLKLAPPLFLGDLGRLRAEAFEPADGELLLIGRRDLRSNNSWMHNAQRLNRGKERCTLLMGEPDAARLGLSDGQRVRVCSGAGEVELSLEIGEIMPGVVSIPHGWGHDREGTRLGVAAQRPGVSINDLTDEKRLDTLTGNAAFSGVRVRVAAAE